MWGDNTDIEIEPTIKIGRMCRLSVKKIGAFTYFNGFDELGAIESIGRFCSIARNVKAGLIEHPTSAISTHPIFCNSALDNWYPNFHTLYDKKEEILNEMKNIRATYTEKKLKRISIGNDVWIGENVTICRGVQIGDGAVCATGAIVTKDVPPYAIVGGVPAKIIKYRFSQDIILKLLNLKWWRYGPDIMKGMPMHDMNQLLPLLEKRINVEKFPEYTSDSFMIEPLKNIIRKK